MNSPNESNLSKNDEQRPKSSMHRDMKFQFSEESLHQVDNALGNFNVEL